MSDDYTLGAGARTLTPEAGMQVYTDGVPMMRLQHSVATGAGWAGWAPDLTDPATRYLALAQLARRVGLDATSGVLWYRSGRGEWTLSVAPTPGQHAGSPPLAETVRRLVSDPPNAAMIAQMERRQVGPLWLHVPGINTDDALDRALWATRGTP
jgi:hypothetical protein